MVGQYNFSLAGPLDTPVRSRYMKKYPPPVLIVGHTQYPTYSATAYQFTPNIESPLFPKEPKTKNNDKQWSMWHVCTRRVDDFKIRITHTKNVSK